MAMTEMLPMTAPISDGFKVSKGFNIAAPAATPKKVTCTDENSGQTFKPKYLLVSFVIVVNGAYRTWVCSYDETVSTTTYILQQDYAQPPAIIGNEPLGSSTDPLVSIEDDGFVVSPDANINGYFNYIAVG